MTDRLTHERCSELLLSYLRETLGDERSEAVRVHLEDCDKCAAELDGLRSLLAEGVPELTEIERHRLRHAVLDEVRPAIRPQAAPEAPRWRRGLAAYAGAAAALVLLVAGGAWLFTGLTTSSTDAGSTGGAILREDRDQAGRDHSAGEVAPEAAQGGENASKNASRSAQDASPGPTFAPAQGQVDTQALKVIGRSDLFANYKRFYTPRAASNKETSFLAVLAKQAPDDLAKDIETCGSKALRTTARAALPTYATTASLLGRDVLVLGFTAADSSGEALDRFLLVAWERGTCDEVVDSVGGAIGK